MIGLSGSYHSEKELVKAIKVLQGQTGQVQLARSVIGQYLVSTGLDDKRFKFRTVCRSAERLGMVEMGEGGPHPQWICLPGDEARLA